MYIPKSFQEEDLTKLHALMQEYNFATLITQHEGAPFATHMPFLLDREQGPYGTLLAHMARANPQWRDFDSTQEALVIFQGPHAYISPSWYQASLSVPTWNYAVAHAYGQPRIIDDQVTLYTLLQSLTQRSESQFEQQWRVDMLPDDWLHNMMKGIVGFSIEIARLEGKFKLNQNRPTGDQTNVVTTLKNGSDPLGLGVADLMEKRLVKE